MNKTVTRTWRLPYYSETGAKFVREVVNALYTQGTVVIPSTQGNINTLTLKWYNGVRFLRDVYPRQYKIMRLYAVIMKKYDDKVVFSSYSSTMFNVLYNNLKEFLSNTKLKPDDIFEATDVDISTEEWSIIRDLLSGHSCDFDIDEARGRLIVIYKPPQQNENTGPTTNAEHRPDERRGIEETPGAVHP